ncbi:alpha-N-acetylglucosaminidase [Brachybacterium sp. ACRRE]|uniref:alpha-N-acetylglucosaminidase n=1 Tax=Brachybacterium sp. ACRRE TaxID=2918184 RepID=UPI001EF3369D|nr:alpha-N-acetylglucosaminidase [Brachybacterium sp. ACRRE]
MTISAANDVLHIEATTVSAAGVGLARALELLFDADLSWDGPDLIAAEGALPDLPPQRFSTHLHTRYHLNPVAFGYSTAFWDWERWERHIDWMAMHGVTMPLNLVGHEAVLVAMLRDLGMRRADAARYVGGTVFLPWTTMGVTHDLGGPLTEEMLEARARLGRRIAERERELGMTVVLPGFGGQLPEVLVGERLSIHWQGWRSFLAAPGDALFARAAESLHRHQRELLGSDHHYAVDPYIESLPPSSSPEDLAAHAGAIFAAMRTADEHAVWVLQGWPFHYQADFWTDHRVRSLLSRIPEERLILLDLWAEHAPMWRSTEAMYGRRWLWCLAHDFGGRFALFGDLASLNEDLEGLRCAAADGTRGQLEGFGITAEAVDENPVVYELALRALWSPMPTLRRWRMEYSARRYGTASPDVLEASETIAGALYGRGRTRATPSPLIARPWSRALPFASQRLAGEALPDPDGPPSANLDAENDEEMLRALPRLRDAAQCLARHLGAASAETAPGMGDATSTRSGSRAHAQPLAGDALAHDAAEIAIHVAAQSARAPLRAMVSAADAGDAATVRSEARTLEALIRGVDRLTATRPEMLVGRWIADARAWAGHDERAAEDLERDARSLISVWGEQSSGLHDYSARHWSGSLTDLHLARWLVWADWLAATAGSAVGAADPEPLRSLIRALEEDWRGARAPYPTTPRGDTAEAIKSLLDLAASQIPRLVADARAPA